LDSSQKDFPFFNVRRFLNIIYSKLNSPSKLSITLEAEKAQVEWNYILTTIKEFNLDDITTLTLQCKLISIDHLFAIAIEPLAIAIRLHPQIPHLSIGQIDHIISLYADNVLLYLSDPERSVPPLFDFLNSFRSFFGYSAKKVNLCPSVII